MGGDIDPALLSAPGASSLIASRARELGLTEEAYADLVLRAGEESAWLRSRIVPPETWFFRYPASFEHLRSKAREHFATAGAAPLRVASLGCANGPEAFSIAAALDGIGPAAIIAVDRDRGAIESARAGRCPPGAVREPPPRWGRHAWTIEQGEVRVRDHLRRRIEFVHADLFDSSLPARLGVCDIVFCRNMAIYLAAEWRCRLGSLIRAVLGPGGWLFHGHAESAAAFGLPWDDRAAAAFAVRASAPAHPEAAATAILRADRSAPPPTDVGPETSAPDLEQVRALADLGRIPEALEAAERLHRKGERSPRLLELLGVLSLASNRLDDAERHLRAALYLDPSRETAAVQLALLSERHRG